MLSISRFTAQGRRRRYSARLRAALDLAASADGRVEPLDIETHSEEVLSVLRQLAAGSGATSPSSLRLMNAVLDGSAGPALMDQLSHNRADVRRAAAQACGLLQLEIAVPVLAVLVSDRDRSVRVAATAALGRIGGHRAADALMRALRSRRLPMYRLVIALAQAAPDFYLETGLLDEGDQDLAPWLAIALGLRRRSVGRGLLVQLLESEDARVRASACRALAWSGNPVYAPLLVARLRDSEAPVREAAARALRRFPNPNVAQAVAGLIGIQTPPTAAILRGLLARVDRTCGTSFLARPAAVPQPPAETPVTRVAAPPAETPVTRVAAPAAPISIPLRLSQPAPDQAPASPPAAPATGQAPAATPSPAPTQAPTTSQAPAERPLPRRQSPLHALKRIIRRRPEPPSQEVTAMPTAIRPSRSLGHYQPDPSLLDDEPQPRVVP